MPRVRGLDGLRAIAASLVLVAHLVIIYFYGDVPTSLGARGVAIFFVLSGFLITSILLHARREKLATWRLFARFYVHRALRILPVSFVVIAVAVHFWIPGAREFWPWLATYTVNILIAHRGQWIGSMGHYWSLAVEEQFYLVWPFLMLLSPKKWLLPVIAACILIGLGSTFWMPLFGASYLAIYVLPFSHFPELGLGALVAYVVAYRPDLFSRASPYFLPAAAAFAAVVFLESQPQTRVASLLNWQAMNVAVALLIAHCASAGSTRSVIVGALELWPIRWLGKISYGVYLINPIVPMLLGETPFDYNLPHTAFRCAGQISVIIAVASTSWIFFERPILMLKQPLDTLINRNRRHKTEEAIEVVSDLPTPHYF